jgi:hypothetical protein
MAESSPICLSVGLPRRGTFVATRWSRRKVLASLRDHQIRSVVMLDRIIGCPHEEGIDYPDGQACPSAPFGPDVTALPTNASTDHARQQIWHYAKGLLSEVEWGLWFSPLAVASR